MEIQNSELQQQLLVSNKLLERALALLERMPPVVDTLRMARDIKAHVNEPETVTFNKRQSAIERQKLVRHGCNFTPVGLPVVEAELDGDTLRLWTPEDKSAPNDWKVKVLTRLNNVETILLSPGRSEMINKQLEKKNDNY